MQVKPRIAIGGENLIDSVHSITPSGDPLRRDNLGGSPYNVAVAMARQGVFAHYLTPISNDPFGETLCQNLTNEGVMASGPRSEAPTTQAIVTLHDGVPQYAFLRENTAERAVTADIIDAAMPDDATHFHAGSLAFAGSPDADAWEAAFHKAAGQGLFTSLDPNVRPSLIDDPAAYRTRFQRLLSSASLVKLSDEDLAWIYPDLDPEHAMTQLRRDTDASFIALTKGPLGAECWVGAQHCVAENPPIAMLADTIGAGDTFMATLLTQAMAKDDTIASMSHSECASLLKRCIYAACLNCTKHGCHPPTAAAIDAALAKGTT